MSRATPWTIQSFDPDVREAARDAAIRDGLTLGQWLKRTIEDHAVGKGLDPVTLDEEECAGAILERLARVAERSSPRLFSVDPASESAAPRPVQHATSKVDDMLQDLAKRLGDGARAPLKSAPRASYATEPHDTHQSALKEALKEALRLTDREQNKERPVEAPLESPPATSMRRPPEARIDDAPMRSGAATERAMLRKQLDQLARNIGDLPQPASYESVARHPERPLSRPRDEAMNRAAAPVAFDRQPSPDSGALRYLNAKADEIRELLTTVEARSAHAPRIERQLDLLGARIDALAASAATVAETNELMTGLDEIRALVGQSQLTGQMDSVNRKLDQLTRRVEALALAADPSPQFGDLARRIDNVHRRVDSNASLLAKVDTSALEQMMQELAHKLDRPAPEIKIPTIDLSPVESELRRLSNKVEAATARTDNPVLEGLRRDIGSLSARVDAVSVSVQTAAASHMSNEPLEALRKEVSGLSGRIDALTTSTPEVSVLDGLQSQIELLVDRIESLTRRDPPGVNALEAQILQLATKIDAISTPSREEEMLTQLQSEIARLARQFGAAPAEANAPALAMLEQVQGHLARLPRRAGQARKTGSPEAAVDDSISDLFQQIQDLRDATADVAEANERHSDLTPQAVAHPSGGSDLLKRELLDLRAHQETSERRMTQTMSAVHQTMELLVNRLTDLESELCEVRPEPVAQTDEPRNAPSVDARRDNRHAPKPEASKEPSPQVAKDALKKPTVEDQRKEPLLDALPTAPQVDVKMEPGKEATPVRHPGPGAVLSNQASFIAAARRAATAANETEKPEANSHLGDLLTQIGERAVRMTTPPATDPEIMAHPAPQPQPTQTQGPLGALRKALSARRRPILIALAGLVLILGTLQTLRLRNSEKPADVVASAARPDLPQEAQAGAEPAQAAPTPAPAPAQAAAAAPTAEQAPPPQPSLMAAPDKAAAPGFTPPLATNGFDPAPTGARLADAAAAGLPAAQYEMGVRLAEGRGMAQDNQSAQQWLEKAAQQKLAPAQYRLAAMLERGLGGPKDLKRAQELYASAAAQGHVRAMHNLGVLNAEGAGGKVDYVAATSWFRKAADYGLRDSQYNLAILNARGMGVEKNLPAAWAWFTVAATQGDADSAQKREEIAALLTPTQTAAAKAIVEAYRPQTPNPAVNDVAPPPGGWDLLSVTNTPKPAAPGAAPKSKVSKL